MPEKEKTPKEDDLKDIGLLKRHVFEPTLKGYPGFVLPGLLDADPVFVVGHEEAGRALCLALEQEGIKAQAVSEVPEEAEVVISLHGLHDVDSPKQAMALSKEAFLLASRLAPGFEAKGGSLVFVQDTGGAFGHSGKLERAWIGGFSSLAKTCSYEWPKACIRAIDIERAGRDIQETCREIVKELLRGGNEPEIGLKADGERLVLSPIAHPAQDGEPTIDSNSIIVVSGGGRGITAACLISLAKRVHPKIAILGRTELAPDPDWAEGISGDANLKRAYLMAMKAKGQSVTPIDAKKAALKVEAIRETRSTLEALREAGSEVEYIVCDVSDLAGLKEAIGLVRERFGPITTLIHGAGVLADKRLRDKKPEHFDYVFGTKVIGLANLLETLKDEPLKTVCLFSSIVGRSGNIGQSDYGMANEVLNLIALALSKERPDCKVKSIGWGAWESGMVTPALQREFEKRGIRLIPKEEGSKAFLREMLQAKHTQPEVVIAGDISIAGLLEFLDRPKERSFDVLVGKKTHPYLEGHKIQGKVVLPFVMVIEWFLRAAKAFRPEKLALEGRDVRLKKGVILENFESSQSRLTLKLTENEDGTVGVSLLNEGGAVAYTGKVVLSDSRPSIEAPKFEPFKNKPAIDPHDIYGKKIFHQRPFDAILDVEGLEESRFGGRLKGLIEAGWPKEEGWQTDPLIIDGALQLGWLWALDHLGGGLLPVSMRLVRFAMEGPAKGPLRAFGVAKKKGGGLGAVFSVWLLDGKGQSLYELQDIEGFTLPSSWKDSTKS
jgi:NAD(P)-dependent dehydrogenase (short-subunit alcohol dehydrogenase family)